MRIYSFYKDQFELKPLELEITLLAGLPDIKIMGLPDSHIKESQLRIKSALKNQGFSWPTSQQVVVNLRPSHVRKSSRGLEFAIAAAYLWKTGQVPFPQQLEDRPHVYGELHLNGSVSVPEDIKFLENEEVPLLLGESKEDINLNYFWVSELRQLKEINQSELQDTQLDIQSPPVPNLYFDKQLTEILKACAIGRHSLFLCGPAGSGKTTVAQALFHLMAPPNRAELKQIQRISSHYHEHPQWRPFVCPHHSIPIMSMIGGGQPFFPGEITRAHNGFLLLDELLEFDQKVREALREPIEKASISVVRKGKKIILPGDFQLVATSNLCPCGDYIPQKMINCRFSLSRCRSYLEKLTGPLVDRFEVMQFSNTWNKQGELIHLEKIQSDIQEIRKQTDPMLLSMSPEQIHNSIDSTTLSLFTDTFSGSHRRKNAFFKLARSIATVDQSDQIEIKHLQKSLEMTVEPFVKLKHCYY